jgi:hypothetical protein
MMRANSAGTSGFRSRSEIGALFRIASKTTAAVDPANGRLPVTIS